jgi:hypothetical protein
LTPRVVEWLWRHHLAFGKLAMLDGDPDQGKSYVALDLCARLSTGRPMPDDSLGPGIVSSLMILQDEDSAEDTTRPRLAALGADLDRVHTWRDVVGRGPPLRLQGDTDLLEAALNKTGARLVLFDPIMAFLDPSVTANSDQGVRRALSPLAHLADRMGAAALLALTNLSRLPAAGRKSGIAPGVARGINRRANEPNCPVPARYPSCEHTPCG